jgi:hypothetical protein
VGPTPSMKRQRAFAAAATIAGVAGILVFASMRQRGQTESFARQYVGEQWDVARNCLLGTPQGRGEGRDAIQRRLRGQLFDALAASEDEARDRGALWPARCAGIFPSLHADRSILRRDPGNALSTLEVLGPRVLAETSSAAAADARAMELVDPIARLDAAMPAGQVHRPRAERRRVDPSHLLASLACPSTAAPRALLDPALFDELAPEQRALLDREGPFDRIASCGAAFFAKRGDQAWRIARGHARIELRPAPSDDAILACGAIDVLAWRDAGRWRGFVCEGARCEPVPPLAAGADLALAVRGTEVLAIARGRRTDLSLARVLRREAGRLAWTDPIAVGRGVLSAGSSHYRLALCRGPVYRSDDGESWIEVE